MARQKACRPRLVRLNVFVMRLLKTIINGGCFDGRFDVLMHNTRIVFIDCLQGNYSSPISPKLRHYEVGFEEITESRGFDRSGEYRARHPNPQRAMKTGRGKLTKTKDDQFRES